MGYYENPPIINLGGGAEKIAAGAASAANSIAEALIKRGERKREEEKEQKLTIQKLQDQKNKTDLYYNKKLSDWATKNKDTGNEVDAKIRGLLQQKIQQAADAQIALTMETDPTKRAEYLKIINNADTFMSTAADFSKSVAMDTATWRESVPGMAVGKAGGWVINGKDAREINARTGAVEILGGMTAAYDNHMVDIIDEGGTFSVKVKGRRKGDSEDFDEVVINANSYLNSDKEGAGGFLQKVENIDEFHAAAKKPLLDENGAILPAYFGDATETVDVESEGDKYKLQFAKRLNVQKVKEDINSQAAVRASGYLRADKEASLRALLNYTLKLGPEYYDSTFKNLGSTEAQQAELTKILSEDVFNTMTEKFSKKKDKNGNIIYFGGEGARKVIEETPTKGSGKTSSGGVDGLTANKRLEMQQEADFAAKQIKKLGTLENNGLIYSPDKNSRMKWDPTAVVKDANGKTVKGAWILEYGSPKEGYKEDESSPAIRSKNKAAAEFLGYDVTLPVIKNKRK